MSILYMFTFIAFRKPTSKATALLCYCTPVACSLLRCFATKSSSSAWDTLLPLEQAAKAAHNKQTAHKWRVKVLNIYVLYVFLYTAIEQFLYGYKNNYSECNNKSTYMPTGLQTKLKDKLKCPLKDSNAH